MDLFNNTNTSQAGFRLQYLEVYNWGTFNKVRWNIHPNGNNALLTGDIGSGKSTLVDALTCLLVPHNKIVFNKAAGAEGKERNLLSYVRGEYKKEKEEITKLAKKVYLRPDDGTYTVIIGNFKNEGYEENVCLAQFFWIGKEGKVDKSLIISPVPLTVKEHFSNATDVNDLKKRLRSINGIQFFNENFTQYSETFRRLFGMNSEKAIDLFYQTVSMKSVSSLTDFVRDQMLEKTDVKEQISALLKRFDDLNKAHAAVVHAREQHQILKPLTEDCADYEKLNLDIEEIEAMLEVLPAWFARRKLELLEVAISDTSSELEKGLQSQNRTSAELNELENRRAALIQDIAQNGGNRVEQIAVDIKRHEQDKDARKKEFDEYEELISQAGLKPIQQEPDFDENVRMAIELDESCTVLQTTLREQRDSLKSELTKQETEYQLEFQELQSLKARKTQIPDRLIRFRSQLCIDLRLAEFELPFVGELIKVNEQESAWEGAIERLFHDAGISLLVPRNHYKSVSKYVNDNPLRGADGTGIKLTFLEADLGGSFLIKELDDESVVHKIDIKPDSPFRNWLEDYLRRIFGDCICTDINGLQHVPYGLTPQGLIKSGRIRHIKDDRRRIDDKRNYVLGWSNIEKIKALEASVSRLKQRVDQLTGEIKFVEGEERDNQNSKLVLDRILQFKEFGRIDWQYHVQKIHELNKERHELLNNNDVLAGLQRSKEEVEQLISQTKIKERELAEKIGALKNDIKNFEEQKVRASNQSGQFDTSKYQKWYPVLDEKLAGQKLSLKNIEARQEEFRKQYEGDTGELKKLRFKLSSSRSAIEKRMRQIREHSRAEYSEVAETIDARSEYITKYKQLVSEDLKRHEERFKEELNKNVIQSIAVFDNKLRKHEDEIRRKISSINQHLAEIDYNATQSTFITILMESAASKEVRQFREDLKACYKNTLGNPDEIYSEEKYEQVKRILDRFASMENVDKEWTSSVTDVRQWFEFNASERYRLDNTEKEFYEGSGGKSGGQKEKLAYTILASALAYQFGLQFGESKSKSFRFVVIDEAFGRGSDESTRYGLELFKKLNLQLLIVTPLQKIHVIENHVNSFHFVSNREGNNSQVSNFTKDEYEMEKQKHHLIKASLVDDQS